MMIFQILDNLIFQNSKKLDNFVIFDKIENFSIFFVTSKCSGSREFENKWKKFENLLKNIEIIPMTFEMQPTFERKSWIF